MVLGGWAAPLDLQVQVAWPTQQVDTVQDGLAWIWEPAPLPGVLCPGLSSLSPVSRRKGDLQQEHPVPPPLIPSTAVWLPWGPRPWRALVPQPKAGLAQSTTSYPRTPTASRAPPSRSGPWQPAALPPAESPVSCEVQLLLSGLREAPVHTCVSTCSEAPHLVMRLPPCRRHHCQEGGCYWSGRSPGLVPQCWEGG